MCRLRLSMRLGCLLAVSAIAACAGKPEVDTRFAENKSLFADIGKADQLTLYEGLPHQGNERQLFEQEQSKETVTLHGYPFYRAPLDVPAEEVEKLRSVLGSASSFLQWRGERKCGGFHPDYCAEWRAGGNVYRVLICFGCGEVKVHGPDKSLRCDVEDETREKLKELLKKHRKNRPPEQSEP